MCLHVFIKVKNIFYVFYLQVNIFNIYAPWLKNIAKG